MFCIFFFKQKTAYEMRISDWSSDVCSSDLALGFTKVKVVEDVALNSWTQVNTDVTGRYAIFAGEYGESNDYIKLSGIEGEVIEVPEPGTLALIGTGQLGRAPCWERGCQYV